MNRTEHLLTILGEECNEIAQRVSKVLRFGADEVQPGQELTNAQRVTQELNDLLGVWLMLRDRNILGHASDQAQHEKMVKVERFLDYSRQCGTLTEREVRS